MNIDCGDGRWTTPRPLQPGATPYGHAARNPSIVASAQGLFVVGNDVPFFDEVVRIGRTLTAWRDGHGPIGAPRGEFVFGNPRAALDAHGNLRMLWAEPATHGSVIPEYRWPLLEFASVWTATYGATTGWSKPEELHRGAVIWNGDATGNAFRAPDGEIILTAPTKEAAVLVFILDRGIWKPSIVPTVGPAAYSTAIIIGHTRVMAIVADDTAQRADVNSVYVYRQVGEGEWQLSRRLQRSGLDGAFELRLSAGPDGRLHLVWKQTSGADLSVIRHVESTDRGASWSSHSDFAPGSALQRPQALVDRCGRVHVVYEDWSRGPNAIRLVHAVWDKAWSRPTVPHPTFLATDPVLVLRPDSVLMLAFWGTEGNPADRAGYRMWYSELR